MRLGTRGSALALAQAGLVAGLLPGEVEIVPVTTTGDRGDSREDKSRWVKELELALLAGEIDLALHSAKDVPSELPDGLALVGVPGRADPRDQLCGAAALADLPRGARVGTSSLRRCAQLRAAREDLEIVALRGNVDTRLRKLETGSYDAIVLARAGLERLGLLGSSPGAAIDPGAMTPAPGQGTLVLEGRAGDDAGREAAASAHDEGAAAALAAERTLVRGLEASCHTPLGALARAEGGNLVLESFVGLPDGSAWLRDRVQGPAAAPEALGAEAAR
ncbi:MAG: hydroxymethylbilane synthase, partial [Solirubrobacteraceae bacterium]